MLCNHANCSQSNNLAQFFHVFFNILRQSIKYNTQVHFPDNFHIFNSIFSPFYNFSIQGNLLRSFLDLVMEFFCTGVCNFCNSTLSVAQRANTNILKGLMWKGWPDVLFPLYFLGCVSRKFNRFTI